MKNKIDALAKHFDIEADEIEVSRYDENSFEIGSEEFLVLTDEEADEKVADYIRETVWAFRPEFLASHMTGIDPEDLRPIQEKCESANPILIKLIDDLDHFIADAIASDGRGHFLATYDGEEVELENGLLMFRTN